MKTLNSFDKIAVWYDMLTKLVYGSAVIKAQQYFLERIGQGSRILVLGGGTGEFLPRLLQLNPTSEVYFIDASKAMLFRAKRQKFTGVVHFIHGTEQNIPELTFDCILTSFYLDLFTEQNLRNVIPRIVKVMTPHSQWIVTDFVSEKAWHRVMLKTMYIFFRQIASVEATRLADWRKILNEYPLTKKDQASFYRGFIRSELYQMVM